MSGQYVLAIDQSTQATKAILFDKEMVPVCREDVAHKQLINKKGWISHNLAEIYDNTIKAVKNVVEKAGIKKEEVVCVGICNQRETSAAWSRESGIPLAPAIVWQCDRAKTICDKISASQAEIIRCKTGIHLSPYFPAAKYAWMLENINEVRKAKKEKRLCMGTIDSYLLYRLTKTKIYATDYSNASRTQLFNIHTLQWDAEIAEIFGIDTEVLPKVCDSSFYYGETDFDGYFDNTVPICGIIGDSQGALLGQGCTKKGMVKATYGTGSSVMMNLEDKICLSQSGLVTTLAWGIDGKITYAMEGNINYTGAVINWLKDECEIISSPQETQKLAMEANKSDKTYIVPAFSGLGAPYWKEDARAIMDGMSRITGRKEIVKAGLESIAYQIRDILDIMKAETKINIKQLCVDGGPTKNRYLMQFQSDILDTKVILSTCEESSALGAALLAGKYIGIYSLDDNIKKASGEEYTSCMTESERTIKYAGWKKAIKKAII